MNIHRPSRPYLLEVQSQGANRFQIASFLTMCMFFGLIFMWLWSARPSLYNIGHWIAPGHIPDWYEYQKSKGIALGSLEEDVEIVSTSEPARIQDVFVNVEVITPEPIVIEVVTPEPVIIQEQLTDNPKYVDASGVEPGIESSGFPDPTAGSTFRNQAQKFCGNCQGYSVRIRYTHYYPPLGGMNCWNWNDETQYCDSPTYSGIPWESGMYWGAACPYDWGIGTWIEVPYWGSVMCIDRGDMVCIQDADGWLCEVDILAPSIGKIDGQVLQSVVFIP